jgi:MraZ protein
MGKFLLGSYSARIDQSGRIKIPEKFRVTIEENYGKELFVTSLNDLAIQIYPLPVWEELAGLTKVGFLHLKTEIKQFMRRVNVKGSQLEIDTKGRVLISPILRENAQLDGDIEVIGLNNHLEIWNKTNLEASLAQNPLTDENFDQIAQLADRIKIE